MKEVLPFELLQDIVEHLEVGQSPVELCGISYRPIVFRVNTTNHYVFCLIPVNLQSRDFFNEVGDRYEMYLDGLDTGGYLFFRSLNSDELKGEVINWYKNCKN